MIREARLNRLTAFVLAALMIIGISCAPMPIYTSKNRKPPKSSRSSEKAVIAKSTTKPVSVTGTGKTGGSNQTFRKGQVLRGISSYYGPGFHGKLTANGETYNQNGLTCAHRSLPFGTVLKVTLLETGKSVKVRVNDRGPYIEGRILDLSVGAARRIGLIKIGTGEVTAKIITLKGN